MHIQGDKLRGGEADVVICEEAASIPPATMDTIVVPMLLMKNTTVLAISTVLGSDNAYSQLMERADPRTGKPYFQQVRVNLKCTDPSCAAGGDLCWHNAHLIPTWHTIAMHNAARNLLVGSPAVRDRELMGQVADEGVRMFKSELLDLAFAPAHDPATGPMKFLVVSVDPNNGGTSEYALVTAAYTRSMMVLIGMDTTPAGEIEEHEQLFCSHVARALKMAEGAHVYLAVEANYGEDTPGMHEGWMRNVGIPAISFTSMRERGGNGKRTEKQRGLWTTAAFKRTATDDFRVSLSDRRIRLAKAAFSIQGREMGKEAAAQLKRWCEYTEPARVPGGADRRWIGGKGKTGALPDDLAMCLIMNHAVSRMLMGPFSAKYAAAQKLAMLMDA